MRAVAAIAICAAAWSGCTGGGPVPRARFELEGSLSVVMDLGWDECLLDDTADEVSVRFVRTRGIGDGGALDDTPLKVVWAKAGQDLVTPSTIDLAEARPDDAARQRGIVTRNVLSDTGRSVFPKLVRGKMTFFDQIRPESTVKGQLNITFENGIEFASGRTIFGPFTAKVP